MTHTPTDKNEEAVAKAFNRQSPVFDDIYAGDTIIQYKRKRVRDHMLHYLPVSASILEINAGTGEDAIYFAQKGCHVHATDIASDMLERLRLKVKEQQLEMYISSELCSFSDLENLLQQGPYDHILSNFAGLNCTGRLGKVLDSFYFLLKPGGYVTLVMLPPFCLWEFMLLFKGKFKTAIRRFAGRKGARAHVEGTYFRCWYYWPSFIKKHLKATFDAVAIEGLCTVVPPSYIQHFAEKHPKTFALLENKENAWKRRWPWKVIGDYYIITLKKKM